MNKRIEELKKLLNQRRWNAEQDSRENSGAQNFDTSNPNNLNLNAENNLKFQNLDSDSTDFKNSEVQARDYDKDPLIIKDYAFYDYMKYSAIATLIGCLFFISVKPH